MNLHEITADGEWLTPIAKAACLQLNDAERERFAVEICNMLSALDGMEDPGEQESCDVAVSEDQLREDLPKDCLPREELLRSAAGREGNYFSTSRAIEERGAGA